jgi:hypothetical protein
MNLSQTVQLTRLGKIRLGIKVPIASKNAECRKKNHPNEEICMFCSYPVQTDYFVFDEPGDYPPGIREALNKEYGEKPTSLQFFFPTENRSLVFPQALKYYKGPRLFCRGDGMTATRVDEASGGMFSMKCPCEFLGNGCAPRASLMIALYKIKIHGVFQVDTGSIHNIIRTNSFMNEIGGEPEHPETVYQSLLRRISYVPLRLSLIPQQINIPDGKTVTKPLWVFMFDGDARQAAMLRQRDAISALLPGQPELPALPPAPDDRHDEIRDASDPTLNGKPLTPPDLAATEPEVVDAKEGTQDERTVDAEVVEKEAPPMREPGADEHEDDPFPPDKAPSEPPPNEYAGVPGYLMRSKTKADCEARWNAVLELVKKKPAGIQTAIRKVYDDKMKELAA